MSESIEKIEREKSLSVSLQQPVQVVCKTRQGELKSSVVLRLFLTKVVVKI